MDARERILRLPEVCKTVGLSKTVIYDLMKKDQFPARLKLSARTVGWAETSVLDWCKSRQAV